MIKIIKLNEKPVKYDLQYKKVKNINLRIKADGSIYVSANKRIPKKVIDEFILSKADFILKALDKYANRQDESGLKKFTIDEIKALAEKAKAYIPQRVEYYAQIIGVNYGRITIRNQVSRWGSCSAKGNLNFNCLLMLAPFEVVDYVVVHELCHLKEMNHSKIFWNEVEQIIPNYREHKKWLRDNGRELIEKL